MQSLNQFNANLKLPIYKNNHQKKRKKLALIFNNLHNKTQTTQIQHFPRNILRSASQNLIPPNPRTKPAPWPRQRPPGGRARSTQPQHKAAGRAIDLGFAIRPITRSICAGFRRWWRPSAGGRAAGSSATSPQDQHRNELISFPLSRRRKTAAGPGADGASGPRADASAILNAPFPTRFPQFGRRDGHGALAGKFPCGGL